MRDNQRPKYLNTSDGELYHKGSQLFGIDLARGAAARAGRAILVEGYTDVLALHQAGLRNAVGIMGTALTEEQVGQLERTVRVLELCLDADRAGQDAMMRAARLAAGRSLELRVVPLPEGADPADLVTREGGEALRARVEGSVPFVVFEVDRILSRADVRSAEGRDRAVAELRPVLADLAPSVLREDLVRRVAGKLELSEGRVASLVTNGKAPTAGGAARDSSAAPVPTIDHSVRAERTFLVLCVALPEAGNTALAAIDPEQHLTSAVLRRAARHLAGQTELPLTDLPTDDEELAHVVADLVARAGRGSHPTIDRLEHARLVLDLARLDRAIRRARGERVGDVGDLAREREGVLAEIRNVTARLEQTV
jgi:DNA primase